MSTPREPSSEDARFVERLSERYAPAPLSAQRRAELQRELEARLARRPVPRLALVAATTALAAALLWGAFHLGREAGPEAPRTAAAEPIPWEYAWLYPDGGDGGAVEQSEALLPEEYVAIGELLLDG